jgi:hypothetical protein
MPSNFLNFTIPLTVTLLGFGAFFIFDSVSNAGSSQLPEVMAGALLLASGLMLLPREIMFVYRWVHSARVHDGQDW